MQTIRETIENLHASLIDYIEATYHISARPLIEQRKFLLNQDGVIHSTPYLESTPKYQTGGTFASMTDLPTAASILFSRLSADENGLPKLIYDPPYKHQADSLRHNLIDGKNLVIMTGTGSGKTESFLLPILGKFAKEAETRPDIFVTQPAMRALIMYPINALVNDQLGRLRKLFGDPRLVKMFKDWCGRPPRFARYTSRTPYPGVRTSKKDQKKLKTFDSFYIDILKSVEGEGSYEKEQAEKFLNALEERGKWPAKPDILAWFGEKGRRWQDSKTGEFLRATTQPDDSELLTRHEVQCSPPDLLVTNYSMLEYMLMRPIERRIFDLTRDWLAKNPEESFLIVLDEAHLYRGAAGAEVGLLLRRLRDRLGISDERFKVICATASFRDVDYAPRFGAQLSGVPSDTFVPIRGELDLKSNFGTGTKEDADALSKIDLSAFYAAETNEMRIATVNSFLDYRGVTDVQKCERALFEALDSFKPMGKLINTTMKETQSIDELGPSLFSDDVPSQMADSAVATLMALGSVARLDPKLPGLLPCRIHNFFRGLPGLWVCMDPNCSELSEKFRNGICGKMYSQPMNECSCGARVLEFFTCRNCGTAYARAYTNDVDMPRALWAEPGESLRMANGEITSLLAIDLLLEQPVYDDKAELADYDLQTGQLNPNIIGQRKRIVYIRKERLFDSFDEDDKKNAKFESRGQFIPCAVCAKTAFFGQSSVQDHQTKGDQPFQALVSRQIQIQPPSSQEATSFAPLRGRKVLAFSDSRQVAARLAPNLQMYSERDSLRSLIVKGFRWLQEQNEIIPLLNLDDLYFGVLLASKQLNVRLRPKLHDHENFFDALEMVENAIDSGDIHNPPKLLYLLTKLRTQKPPRSLLNSMLNTLTHRFWGMETLALATLMEKEGHEDGIIGLPEIPDVAETDEAKLALARFWLRCWTGFGLTHIPSFLVDEPSSSLGGYRIKSRKTDTKFKSVNSVISNKDGQKIFWKAWAPKLLDCFTLSKGSRYKYLNGSELSLQFDGDWAHCQSCKSVHRPIPGVERCLDCGNNSAKPLNPNKNSVFLARKGFYRKPVLEALLESPRPPMALIAAEHTAQLNSPQNEDVFSKAEENELCFQDIELPEYKEGSRSTAIDVLSSTTTMEVGIDIGTLSGVALRNMPPGRANYQQRAGRAGRRGNVVATVVAFGSADSHDEHYFSKPEEMIRGDVVEPKLTLDNVEIARRHIRAFLLQNYHQDKLPGVNADQPSDLFSVLGSVADFQCSNSPLNRYDFNVWLNENEAILRKRIDAWIPRELTKKDRDDLINNFIADCIKAVDDAIRPELDKKKDTTSDDEDDEGDEEVAEEGEERPQQASKLDKLLDRLLYCGKLPRYAFPTDVAAFHVFNKELSSRFQHNMEFEPSRGLPIALSEYAPGKQVWISGKCYTSGAIYSVMKNALGQAWRDKRLYMECSDCGFAKTFSIDNGEIKRGDKKDCDACGGEKTFGPARYWMRPPGFAHPINEEEVTSPDEIPETSYATRAKLTMGITADDERWKEINTRIRALKERQHLLVSNTGPRDEGYTYCIKCGRIEASRTRDPILGTHHQKPFPDKEDKRMCEETIPVRRLVLGTDFITDIALFSICVTSPLELRPGLYPTNVALRTVSEALAKAACQLLEVEPGELMAEYRPALTSAGKRGLETEIFLYDTLPGGAGFASNLVDSGLELFQRAYGILKECLGKCDASCYRCLRSFKNKFEHKLLDRHVGAELLEYLLTGQQPRFNEQRLKSSYRLLLSDLQNHDEGETVSFYENEQVRCGIEKTINVPILARFRGKSFIVALSSPLTDKHPADPLIAELRDVNTDYEVIVQNELIVRHNLPEATQAIYRQIRSK